MKENEMSENYPNAGEFADARDEAIKPYADAETGSSSGWSGSQASKERAHSRDASGKTGRVSGKILEAVQNSGTHGATIKEIRERYTDEHHGTLSGALTGLHKAGKVLRLTETRDRCSVYVTPPFLRDREAVPPKRRRVKPAEAPAVSIERFSDRPSEIRVTATNGQVIFDGVDRSALLRKKPIPTRQDLSAAIKDIFYAARDQQRTMHQAADEAADAILEKWF